MRNRGFSLLEVLVAVVILAVALIPVTTMGLQQNQGTWFNEWNLVARARARRVAEGLAAQDYEALRAAAGGSGELPSLLAPVAAELQRLSGTSPLSAHLAHAAGMVDRMTDEAFFEEFSAEGLGRVVARVSWRMPGEGPATKLHEVRYTVFVSRRDLSTTRRPPAADFSGGTV